jgi:hypothetical protein
MVNFINRASLLSPGDFGGFCVKCFSEINVNLNFTKRMVYQMTNIAVLSFLTTKIWPFADIS